MIIKQLKEELEKVPEDYELNVMFEKSIPEDILNLLDFKFIITTYDKEKIITLLTVCKNYYTTDEVENILKHYKPIEDEYKSKESNCN